MLNRRTRGRAHQYLVRWRRYGSEADVWVPGKELEDTQVLQDYNTTHELTDEDVQTTQLKKKRTPEKSLQRMRGCKLDAYYTLVM